MNIQLVKELKEERNGLSKQLKDLEEILAKEKDLRNRIAAIDGLLSYYDKDAEKIEISQPTQNGHSGYDPQLIWEDKCLFVLKELGSGFSNQVVKKIMEHEPELNITRVTTAASFYLSKLLRDGKVKKIGQYGRKYKFGLN